MLRAFVALRLNIEVEEEIVRVQGILRGMLEGISWVPSDKLHLTLKFFAAISEEGVLRILSALRRDLSDGRPFVVQATGLGVFPDSGNPRVIWIGLRGEELLALYKKMERSLKALGFEPEERPFLPHITIARVRNPVARRRLKEEILNRRDYPFGSSRVGKLIFYRSDLTNRGSVYTSLGEISIGQEA